MVGGSVLIGLGVTLSLRSGLGAAPWEVFHEGLARFVHADIGLVALLVGVAALLLWFPLRLRPSVGTYLTVVLIAGVVHLLFPAMPQGTVLPLQYAMTMSGVLATGFGVACCIRSQLGTGPRDGIALGLARLGLPLWQVRVAVDVTLVGIGFLLGGTFGIGTLIEAFTVGPIIACALAVSERSQLRPVTSARVRVATPQ